MAVAFDAGSGNADDNSSVASISCTHVVGAGSNRAILIGIGQRKDTYFGTNITGVTVGGVAATHIGTGVIIFGTPSIEVYGLVAPASGSLTVTASFSGGNTGDWPTIVAISADGVDQTTPFGTPSEDGDIVTNSDQAIASAVDDLVTQFLYANEGDWAPNSGSTAPSGCTQYTFFGANAMSLGMYKAGAAGTTTVGASGTSTGVTRVGVAFKAAAGGGGGGGKPWLHYAAMMGG